VRGFHSRLKSLRSQSTPWVRVWRRTSTKQRESADRIIYSIFPPPACTGKDPGGKPSQWPGWVLGCAP